MATPLLESTLQRWRALAPRERRLVSAAVTLVLAASIYLLMFEPAWLGRERLARELPQLRTQLAQMDLLAAEASELGSASRTPEPPQAVRARIEQSIDAAGLRSGLSRFDVNGSLFDLRFASVPSAIWLQWLDVALRDTRVRVVDATVTRETTPGLISARVALEIPRADGS